MWRPRRVRAVALPTALAMETGACLLAALLPGGWRLADRLGVAALGTILTVLLLLMARPAVRADEHGVTVVNILASRRLAWSEVIAVGLGRDDPWASADLADGTTFAVMAFQAADGDRARRGVAEMGALVRARGEAPGGPR